MENWTMNDVAHLVTLCSRVTVSFAHLSTTSGAAQTAHSDQLRAAVNELVRLVRDRSDKLQIEVRP